MDKSPKLAKRRGGPYLEAAFICEQVLRDKDGAYSAIRMVNRLNLHEAAIEKSEVIALPLTGIVAFKAGDFKGSRKLALYVTNPSGKRGYMPVLEHNQIVNFEGGDTGAITCIPLFLKYDKPGTYWIDVVMNGRRCSRIPLTLVLKNEPLRSPDRVSEQG